MLPLVAVTIFLSFHQRVARAGESGACDGVNSVLCGGGQIYSYTCSNGNEYQIVYVPGPMIDQCNQNSSASGDCYDEAPVQCGGAIINQDCDGNMDGSGTWSSGKVTPTTCYD